MKRVTQSADAVKAANKVTDVIFRKYPKSEGGDIVALFPGDPGTSEPYTCSCYQHVGQHGSANPHGCILRTQPAQPEEYADLKRELEGAPYSYRLRVVKRLQRAHLEARRAALRSYQSCS